tara:strand:+ start:472 stop:705 length:234 start_codon:yes stop_codon:yes gene_type:complete
MKILKALLDQKYGNLVKHEPISMNKMIFYDEVSSRSFLGIERTRYSWEPILIIVYQNFTLQEIAIKEEAEMRSSEGL